MLRNSTLWNYLLAIAFTFLVQFKTSAQSDKLALTDNDIHKDDVVMTWGKNTPESEMKDDIKALGEKGITIKYSDVKRNSKEEITSIRVDYSDRKGNKGTIEYNNQKSIPSIKFYRNGEEIGFGEPNNSNMIAENNFMNMNDLTNPQDFMKQFQLGNGGENSQSFSFSFPNDGGNLGQSKSKIMIQKDGKKPLVIEDGKITEGGDDYTQEEIEKIKSENKVENFGKSNENVDNSFDLRNQEGLEKYKKQMQKIQGQLDKIIPDQNQSDNTKSDFEQSQKEIIKSKEELEKEKKEKSKVKIKIQKV